MNGRWITVSLVALALASCNKKDEVKPPPPKPDAPVAAPAPAPAPTPAPAPATAPASEDSDYKPAPPAAGVTPVTTPDAPATFIPTKPRPILKRPPVKVVVAKPAVKVVRSKAQAAAERQVVGAWLEQKRRESVLRFTADGKVTAKQGTTITWTGEWKADPDGAVQFTLHYNNPSNPLKLTAYPTPARIMAVIPHWGDSLPGQGQYAYERFN